MDFLFLDEQADGKTLQGAHVSGDTAGEFVWKPGVLTQAVREGRWFVLEDVDQAPAEVIMPTNFGALPSMEPHGLPRPVVGTFPLH